MKALSGYAEWFWLMAKNWKDVENRSWPLSRYCKALPVRVYLHASKTPTPADELQVIWSTLNPRQLKEFYLVNWKAYRGAIIGEITFTENVFESRLSHPIIDSPWFYGPYGFVAKDGVLYEHPIPYKGSLGLFEINLEGEQRKALLDQAGMTETQAQWLG